MPIYPAWAALFPCEAATKTPITIAGARLALALSATYRLPCWAACHWTRLGISLPLCLLHRPHRAPQTHSRPNFRRNGSRNGYSGPFWYTCKALQAAQTEYAIGESPSSPRRPNLPSRPHRMGLIPGLASRGKLHCRKRREVRRRQQQRSTCATGPAPKVGSPCPLQRHRRRQRQNGA